MFNAKLKKQDGVLVHARSYCLHIQIQMLSIDYTLVHLKLRTI